VHATGCFLRLAFRENSRIKIPVMTPPAAHESAGRIASLHLRSDKPGAPLKQVDVIEAMGDKGTAADRAGSGSSL